MHSFGGAAPRKRSRLRSRSARSPRAHAGRSPIMDVEPFSMSEPTTRLGRIGILWRGGEAARRSARPETSRFKAVFAALAPVGLHAEPVVYEDEALHAPRAQPPTLPGPPLPLN